jgi:purine-binding chemotaxis protein CheW
MSDVHVRFRIGPESYALPVGQVLEVADIGQLSRVPGTPPAVLGVRNLRGQVLPVFDLASVLGTARDASAGKLVITEEAGRRAGLAIDEVTDVGELGAPVQKTDSPFLSGSTLVEGELVGIVDVEVVFAAIEREVEQDGR